MWLGLCRQVKTISLGDKEPWRRLFLCVSACPHPSTSFSCPQALVCANKCMLCPGKVRVHVFLPEQSSRLGS